MQNGFLGPWSVKMGRFSRRLLATVGIMLAVLLLTELRAQAGTIRNLTRQDDALIIQGRALSKFLGRNILQMRLYAFQGAELKPIPFQIDERDAKGILILRRGKQTGRDVDNWILDGNDELVFMARDLGDKGNPAAAFPSAPGFEIEATDPLTGEQGWAYLLYFSSNPPSLSQVDYVSLETLSDGRENIRGQYYELSYPKNHVFFDTRKILPAGGGTGVDLLDRLKIRGAVKLKWFLGGMTIRRDENDFITETMGYIDGPVRVVRRTANQMRLVSNIVYSPRIVVDGIYYYSSFFMPSRMSVPVDASGFLDDMWGLQIQDLSANSKGMTFYNNNNRQGVPVDGVMSDAEKKMDHGPFEWAVVAGQQGNFLYRSILDKKLPVKKCLYYNDDAAHADPPEDESGEYANNGYDLKGFLKVKRGSYQVDMWGFIMPGYKPGVENKYLEIMDHPLSISVR